MFKLQSLSMADGKEMRYWRPGGWTYSNALGLWMQSSLTFCGCKSIANCVC